MAAKFPAKSQDLPYQKAPLGDRKVYLFAKGSHSGELPSNARLRGRGR